MTKRSTSMPSTRLFAGGVATFALFASALGGGGCSIITAGDDFQCEAETDCARFGTGFSCIEGVCSIQGTGPGTGGDGGTPLTGCVSNEQCINENGQQPYICRNPNSGEECVSLLSNECPELIGPIDNLKNQDSVVIGMIAPDGMDDQGDLQLTKNGALLAIEDLTSFNGLPLGGDGRSDFVVLFCGERDKNPDDEISDAVEGARHLIEDIGVPAIIGPYLDNAAIKEIYDDYARPNRTLLMLPNVVGDVITSIDFDSLIWQFRPSANLQAEATALYLDEYLNAVRTYRELPPTQELKVFMLHSDDTLIYSPMRSVFEANATFNGMNIAENEANGTYDRSQFDPTGQLGGIRTAVLNELPDVIVLFADELEALEDVYFEIEKQWPAGQERPWWLMSEGLRDSTLEAILDDADMMFNFVPTMGDRTYGWWPLPAGKQEDPSVWQEFLSNFGARFEGQNGGAFRGPSGYDGVYLAALGLLAGRSAPTLNGDAIAAGFARLLSGTKVRANAADLPLAEGALSNPGTTIDFQGTLSEYDFDLLTGSNPANLIQWCGDSSTVVFTSSYEWDPETKVFDGLLTVCAYETPAN